METTKAFTMWELAFVGVLSGIAVSLVKLVQAGFYLSEVSATEFHAALLTYLAYIVLGAIGAIILVDHDARGQKMLKSAFLMGFVAPSFFLALLNQPITSRTTAQDFLSRIPKISWNLIGAAQAQENTVNSKGLDFPKSNANPSLKVQILERSQVETKFSAGLWKALGVPVTPVTFAYVVGTTGDETKALAAASRINKILLTHKDGRLYRAEVLKPKGFASYYVTLGDLGTPNEAAVVRDWARDAAIGRLRGNESEEERQAASLVLKGQIVDAKAMFASKRD